MTGKIKVALCLSGEPRNDIYAFPYIYKHFISNPLLETDVYIHSWKDFESLDLYKPKKCLIEYDGEEIIDKYISKLPNLDNVSLPDKLPLVSIPMYYSIYKCFNLIKDPYDIYIRIRFDFYPQLSLNYTPIIKDILNKEYDIFIPKGEIENKYWSSIGLEKGYNDRFAICNYKSFKTYSSTFLTIPDVIKQHNYLSVHHLLYHSLNLKNLKIKYHPFYSQIIRKGNLKIDNYGSTHYI